MKKARRKKTRTKALIPKILKMVKKKVFKKSKMLRSKNKVRHKIP